MPRLSFVHVIAALIFWTFAAHAADPARLKEAESLEEKSEAIKKTTPEVVDLLTRALEIRRKELGETDITVVRGFNALGGAYLDLERYADAETSFREVVARLPNPLSQDELGFVSNALSGLTTALRNLDRFEEAEPIVLRSLEIRRNLDPPDPFAVGRSLRNLGLVYLGQGRNDKAIEVFTEYLALARAVEPADAASVDDAERMLRIAGNPWPAAFSRLKGAFIPGAIAVISLLLLCSNVVLKLRTSTLSTKRSWLGAAAMMGFFIGGAIAGIALVVAGTVLIANYIPNNEWVSEVFGGVATIVVLLSLSLIMQVAFNVARRRNGFPPEKVELFSWSNKKPQTSNGAQPIGPPTLILQKTQLHVQWFMAIEMFAARPNRAYMMFITPRMLSGGYVKKARADSIFAVSVFDDTVLSAPPFDTLYSDVDVAGPEFLTRDPLNFQYEWRDITDIEWLPGTRQWAMASPHTGRLRFTLKNGAQRTLYLVGNQDGAALKTLLDQTRDAVLNTGA